LVNHIDDATAEELDDILTRIGVHPSRDPLALPTMAPMD